MSTSAPEPSRPLSPATTLTLSLAGSLVFGAFSAGTTIAVLSRLQQDVVELRSGQQAQGNALHATELRQERTDALLGGIRTDVAEMKGLLLRMTEEPRPVPYRSRQ
ncbi:hypothetical protein DRW03_21320 [Corallococcus sp. H22C18031201]|nr:hypothetical protein DRW03_21320 [Corallococcus sp. H22C18031201]